MYPGFKSKEELDAILRMYHLTNRLNLVIAMERQWKDGLIRSPLRKAKWRYDAAENRIGLIKGKRVKW